MIDQDHFDNMNIVCGTFGYCLLLNSNAHPLLWICWRHTKYQLWSADLTTFQLHTSTSSTFTSTSTSSSPTFTSLQAIQVTWCKTCYLLLPTRIRPFLSGDSELPWWHRGVWGSGIWHVLLGAVHTVWEDGVRAFSRGQEMCAHTGIRKEYFHVLLDLMCMSVSLSVRLSVTQVNTYYHLIFCLHSHPK